MRNYIKERKLKINIEAIFIIVFSIAFIILSFVYANERMIFSDTSGYILSLVTDESFVVMTNRFISGFSQLLPVIAVKADFSLQTIITAYSINIILIPIFLIIISFLWFKEYNTAISILLFYSIMNNMLFYYPASEFQMGLCFLLFYNGLFDHYKKGNVKKVTFFLISFLFITIIIFSHPLSLLVFLAWSLWMIIDSKKMLLILIGITVLGLANYFVKEQFFKAAYDVERSGMLEKFKTFSFKYLSGHLSDSYFKYFFQNYFIVVIMITLTLVAIIKVKKYLAGLYFVGVIIGFWLLITVSFYQYEYNYYYEHLFQPLTFFIVLFFMQFGFYLFKKSYWNQAIILIVLSSSFIMIFKGKEMIQQRQAWYGKCMELMAREGIKKGIISREYVRPQERETYWSSSTETLILSSVNGIERSQTLYLVWDVETIPQDISDTTAYMGDGYSINQTNLPKKYFDLGNKPYTILENKFGKRELEYLRQY